MEPANLIVIMSDEHDPRYMGAAGDTLVKTPNLDRLAASGTRFTNAYTPSPICVPARAAFATGQYVHRIGYWDNAIAYDGAVRGWGHALQARGIPVESIGKLHYRADEDPCGFDREHIAMQIAGGHGMVWGSVRDPLPEHPAHGKRMLGEYIGPGESSYTRYDRSVAELAEHWLQERASAAGDGPWCLFIGFVAPHFPLVAAQEFFDLYPLDALPPRKLHPRDGYTRHPWVQAHHDFWPHDDEFRDDEERLMAIAAYYALCTWMDQNVGRVIDALDATGLANSTRVIYTSDHGDNVGHRGLWGKSNLYQESVGVPMIMSGPGIATGQCDTPVNLVDLHPTILDALDVPLPGAEPGALATDSLFRIAAQPTDPTRIAFSEYHAVGSPSAGFMLRKGDWKYHYYVGFEPELFNLRLDPEETTDLAQDPQHRAVCEEMLAELKGVCDPQDVDRRAKADQAALIEAYGGREKALQVGAPAATPPPGQS